jgi:hypothetical protein
MVIEFTTTRRASGDYTPTPHTWDLSAQLSVEDFLAKHPDTFVKVGEVISAPKLACGYRIDVVKEWKNVTHMLYLMVIDGKIVKGGKVKGKLAQRSYAAGTEKTWTKKGGECSPTNYVYSQIFRSCVAKGISVEFYGMESPTTTVTFDFLGVTKVQKVSPYEEMETLLNESLRKQLGRKPIGDGDLMEQDKK